jgi:hypothetical protein
MDTWRRKRPDIVLNLREANVSRISRLITGRWEHRGYRKRPALATTFNWKDIEKPQSQPSPCMAGNLAGAWK